MNTEIRHQFEKQGYVIIRNVLSKAEIGALIDQTDDAVRRKALPLRFDSESPETLTAVPAIYKDEQGRVFQRLDRIIDRGGAFRDAVMGPLAGGAGQLMPAPIYVCLNRHNMVMLKAPHNPARVVWHQDSPSWADGTYDHVTCIVALDEFTEANGGVKVVPGSHRLGPIGAGEGWAAQVEAVKTKFSALIDREQVLVDLKPGDAVYFNSLLLHGSYGNQTAMNRRSLTVAFYSGDLSQISTAEASRRPEVVRV